MQSLSMPGWSMSEDSDPALAGGMNGFKRPRIRDQSEPQNNVYMMEDLPPSTSAFDNRSMYENSSLYEFQSTVPTPAPFDNAQMTIPTLDAPQSSAVPQVNEKLKKKKRVKSVEKEPVKLSVEQVNFQKKLHALYHSESKYKRPCSQLTLCPSHHEEIKELLVQTNASTLPCTCGQGRTAFMQQNALETISCVWSLKEFKKVSKDWQLGITLGPRTYKMNYRSWSKNTALKRKGYSYCNETLSVSVCANELFVELKEYEINRSAVEELESDEPYEGLRVALVFNVDAQYLANEAKAHSANGKRKRGYTKRADTRFPFLFNACTQGENNVVFCNELLFQKSMLMTVLVQPPAKMLERQMVPPVIISGHSLFEGELTYVAVAANSIKAMSSANSSEMSDSDTSVNRSMSRESRAVTRSRTPLMTFNRSSIVVPRGFYLGVYPAKCHGSEIAHVTCAKLLDQSLTITTLQFSVPMASGGRWCPPISAKFRQTDSPDTLSVTIPDAPDRWASVAQFLNVAELPVDVVAFRTGVDVKRISPDSMFAAEVSSADNVKVAECSFNFQNNDDSVDTKDSHALVNGDARKGSQSPPQGPNVLGHLADLVEKHLQFAEQQMQSNGGKQHSNTDTELWMDVTTQVAMEPKMVALFAAHVQHVIMHARHRINAHDNRGYTLLHFAIFTRHLPSMLDLMYFGAKVDVCDATRGYDAVTMARMSLFPTRFPNDKKIWLLLTQDCAFTRNRDYKMVSLRLIARGVSSRSHSDTNSSSSRNHSISERSLHSGSGADDEEYDEEEPMNISISPRAKPEQARLLGFEIEDSAPSMSKHSGGNVNKTSGWARWLCGGALMFVALFMLIVYSFVSDTLNSMQMSMTSGTLSFTPTMRGGGNGLGKGEHLHANANMISVNFIGSTLNEHWAALDGYIEPFEVMMSLVDVNTGEARTVGVMPLPRLDFRGGKVVDFDIVSEIELTNKDITGGSPIARTLFSVPDANKAEKPEQTATDSVLTPYDWLLNEVLQQDTIEIQFTASACKITADVLGVPVSFAQEWTVNVPVDRAKAECSRQSHVFGDMMLTSLDNITTHYTLDVAMYNPSTLAIDLSHPSIIFKRQFSQIAEGYVSRSVALDASIDTSAFVNFEYDTVTAISTHLNDGDDSSFVENGLILHPGWTLFTVEGVFQPDAADITSHLMMHVFDGSAIGIDMRIRAGAMHDMELHSRRTGTGDGPGPDARCEKDGDAGGNGCGSGNGAGTGDKDEIDGDLVAPGFTVLMNLTIPGITKLVKLSKEEPFVIPTTVSSMSLSVPSAEVPVSADHPVQLTFVAGLETSFALTLPLPTSGFELLLSFDDVALGSVSLVGTDATVMSSSTELTFTGSLYAADTEHASAFEASLDSIISKMTNEYDSIATVDAQIVANEDEQYEDDVLSAAAIKISIDMAQVAVLL